MELFSISLQTDTPQEAKKYKRMITQTNRVLHKKYKSLSISCTSHGDRLLWSCFADDPRIFLGDDLQDVYEQTAIAVAQFIMQEKEQQLAGRILLDEYDFPDQEEQRKILQQCRMLLEQEVESYESWNRRHKMLVKGIKQCLEENPLLNIEGFLAFRTGEYRKELQEVVEYAVDEFLMDRQYEEFVGLLKYFVYFQEPQVPLVHIIHKGGQDLLLLNERMKPLEHHQEEGFVVERLDQQDMELEDTVVSTLISVSPAKIVIHTREPHQNVISTLMQIFEQRVEICRYCPDCLNYFREMGNI